MVKPLNPNNFPEADILWQRWSAATEAELAQRDRPVLLFVADAEPMVFIFLEAIFQAIPTNARLRELLHTEFPALYVEADAIPQTLGVYGAGSRYHIAILSPHGLNPLVVFDATRDDPAALVAEIVAVLERLLAAWQ